MQAGVVVAEKVLQFKKDIINGDPPVISRGIFNYSHH